MKCVMYRCDYCKKPLSDGTISVPHIHVKGLLTIERQSNSNSRWQKEILNKHNEEAQWHLRCIIKFFKEEMAKLRKTNEFYSTEKV